MQALSKAVVQSWALSGPADAVTSTRGHSSCQWSVRTVFGVIFIDFIEQISLTNCAFRFNFGAIARWPLIAVQTQLSAAH